MWEWNVQETEITHIYIDFSIEDREEKAFAFGCNHTARVSSKIQNSLRSYSTYKRIYFPPSSVKSQREAENEIIINIYAVNFQINFQSSFFSHSEHEYGWKSKWKGGVFPEEGWGEVGNKKQRESNPVCTKYMS